MARLIINDAFSTDLFQFNMQAPFRKMYQHNLQNGNTALDMIANKDRFEITFPYLSQVEYNRLTQYLESLTAPTMKIEYQTDEITRVWDGLTAYSINSLYFSGATPAYVSGALLSEQQTTNYFTTPSAEDGGTANVTGETGLTITNSNTVAKFGTKSYKAVNSAAADWGFLGTGGVAVPNVGRPLWSTSGALLSETVDTNYLLHTSDNPNLAPWNKVNVSATASYPSTVTNTADNGYLEQITNADATPGTTYTLTCEFTAIDPFGFGVVMLYLGDSDFSEYVTLECFAEGKKSLSITFNAPTGAKVKVWIRPKSSNGSWYTFKEPMLTTKSYPRVTFIPTTNAEVSSTPMKAYLPVPFAAYAHQNYSPGLVALMGNFQQSVSVVFRAGGWGYDIQDYVKRTVVAQVGDDYAAFQIYFGGDGFLYVDHEGWNLAYIDVTGWAYQSWHSITLCTQYALVNNEDTQQWKMYVDFDTANPITLDTFGMYPLFGRPGDLTSCYFVLGANMDFDLTTQHNEFDGYVSEFYLGPVPFDKVSTGRTKSVIDIIKQAYNTSGEYNVNSFVLKNDDLALFVRGNELNAYAARTIHFQANPSSNTITLSGSVYVYPEDQTHYRMIGILGRATARDFHGFESEAENGYTNNQKPFPFKQWTRMYVENQVCENTAHAGQRSIFGVAVPIGSTYYFDGVQMEQHHASTSYCDGNQPNCAWSGTAEQSTSTRGNQYTRLPMPSQLANLYDKDWTVLLRFQLPGIAINASSRDTAGEGYESLLYIGEGGVTPTIGIRYQRTHVMINEDSRMYLNVADDNGDAVTVNAVQVGAGPGWANAKFYRDSYYTLAVVYDNTAKQINFYLNGTMVAYSSSLANRHFKNPAYIYLGTTGPTNPLGLYSSMLVDVAAVFGKAIPAYHLLQMTAAMQDQNFVPPASFNILAYYDLNQSTLEATIGNSINEDVKRVRNKVFYTQIGERAHLQNRANKYQLKLQFQEV